MNMRPDRLKSANFVMIHSKTPSADEDQARNSGELASAIYGYAN